MVGESNTNVLLIQIDASNFAEIEISKFEIARVDCTLFQNAATLTFTAEKVFAYRLISSVTSRKIVRMGVMKVMRKASARRCTVVTVSNSIQFNIAFSIIQCL